MTQTPTSYTLTNMPILITVNEAAELLRTTSAAVYAMVERQRLPGVTRIGRRVLFRSADLLDWLGADRSPAPSMSQGPKP